MSQCINAWMLIIFYERQDSVQILSLESINCTKQSSWNLFSLSRKCSTSTPKGGWRPARPSPTPTLGTTASGPTCPHPPRARRGPPTSPSGPPPTPPSDPPTSPTRRWTWATTRPRAPWVTQASPTEHDFFLEGPQGGSCSIQLMDLQEERRHFTSRPRREAWMSILTRGLQL